MKSILKLCVIGIFMVAWGEASAAPNEGRNFALSIRNNVVLVTAVWKDGTIHEGMGFIVGGGDNTGRSVIITPNNIVRGYLPGQLAESISLRSFRKRQTPSKAQLLEVRDHDRNLAVLRSISHDSKQDVIGCSSDAVEGAGVWFFESGKEWHVSEKAGVFKGRFANGQAKLSHPELQKPAVLSPIIIDSGIVGLALPGPDKRYSHILSITEVARAIQRWNLPWSLTRAVNRPCRGSNPFLREKTYYGSEEEVRRVIKEIFQPGTKWETIVLAVGLLKLENYPDVFEMSSIPSEEDLQRIQAYFVALYGYLSGFKAGPFSGDVWHEIENLRCTAVNPAEHYEWVPQGATLRDELIVCRFSIGGVTVPALVFARGHWYLLPTLRFILTILQPE